MIPRLVAFDLDGTLAISKSPLTESMGILLARLCEVSNVAITSGGKLEQFKVQVVARMPHETRFEHFFLLPTSGAALFVKRENDWKAVYEEILSPQEAEHIKSVLDETIALTQVLTSEDKRYGEINEYRGSQVTFSALGQEAPVDEKYAWDPDQVKRRKMLPHLLNALPDYDVKIGGATSIDITKKGINKALGIRRLSEYLSIPPQDMLYIGDALFSGGNDEVVKETGIKTRQVKDPEETAQVIEELLS